ncbi:hypothetical protein AtDm6_1131 [Acetobacter tropicalis]|uniref:Uncharacterized protein n=2 Tax=Acetobacter tropicalis TaxID=104102 RepID=F7VB14_9PROT|nr:hypothetical protein AtDm6_1131 [Acetobacter tropicalis]GAA07559.1 hypothetical protein ATPR_0563 [Acetobacter tropicalis NBRC 101654]
MPYPCFTFSLLPPAPAKGASHAGDKKPQTEAFIPTRFSQDLP